MRVYGNTIQVALPINTAVTVEVGSAAGDRVRLLFSGVKEAGYHGFVWDGLNDAGKQARSGIYTICATAEDWGQCMLTHWYDGMFNNYKPK